jgi:hypothetical protein
MSTIKVFSSILGVFLCSSLYAQSIHEYVPYTAVGTAKDNNYLYLILRKFLLNNTIHYFMVNPEDLSSRIEPATTLKVIEYSWSALREKYSTTPYINAIRDAEFMANTLQDAGITHLTPQKRGIDLTIDLCPSKHPLDRVIFKELINELGKEEKPVPLAVAVTGLWMEKHGDDLQWLLELEKNKVLSITWINHSYNHSVSKTLPLKENFLLEKGTDISFEVLHTEIKMLEEGITPSVFFRFPGLISNSNIFNRITGYGLIPIGSDAWLAKNQWPKEGSIVLVHANGNEPIGVQRFLALLGEERENIASKKWLLFDLRESVVETETNQKSK